MGRSKWINKKDAVSFKLVHRQQNDPLIHDESAPSMVLAPTKGSSSTNILSGKTQTLDDLASQFSGKSGDIRENEGEAADYGVYYDDTEYDYMQHLRDPGTLGNGVVVMEAKSSKEKEKGKGKAKPLDQALKEMDLGPKIQEDMLPSKDLQRVTYQAQQAVPDAISGFQPDMDPRLREVLEALEDEAYVDDDDGIFGELAKDAKELKDHEFEASGEEEYEYKEGYTYDIDADGWESDVTEKPKKTAEEQEEDDQVPELIKVAPNDNGADPDWLATYNQFKAGQRKPRGDMSSLMTTSTSMGKKKRKGALTNPSTYSMTSSSLVRTEGQRFLDERFEVMERKLNDEIDDRATRASNMSTVTTAPRQDFDSLLDDFLDDYKPRGKSQKGKSVAQKAADKERGVQELEGIRRELGPARMVGARRTGQ